MHLSALVVEGTHATAIVEQMSNRVTALDELIQSLLQEDLSDTSTPQNRYSNLSTVQEISIEPRTANPDTGTPMLPADTGTPLMSEESPFFR